MPAIGNVCSSEGLHYTTEPGKSTSDLHQFMMQHIQKAFTGIAKESTQSLFYKQCSTIIGQIQTPKSSFEQGQNHFQSQ